MTNLFEPEIKNTDLIISLAKIMRSRVYTRGMEAKEFEQTLSTILKVPYVISCSNGTAALHLAVKAVGWGRGDKIITSPYSFIATSNALLFEGCIPIFGKIDKNFQMDIDHTITLINKNPSIKGVLIPYIFGHGANVAALKRLKAIHPKVKIIEDAAQAFAPHDTQLHIGSYSDAVTYSFHENKVISTAGEGGAVVTRSRATAAKLLALREQGRVTKKSWLHHIDTGHNYRLTEYQALVGSAQLKRLPKILKKRHALAILYSQELKDSLNLTLPDLSPRSWFGFYIVPSTRKLALKIHSDLTANGIQARIEPFPLLTKFNQNKSFKKHAPPEDTSGQVLQLPLHTRLSSKEVKRISSIVIKHTGKSEELPSAEFYTKIAPTYSKETAGRARYIDGVNDFAVKELKKLNYPIEKILDIGCGDGSRTVVIAGLLGIAAIGCDQSLAMVTVAKKSGVDAYQCDIAQLSHSFIQSNKGSFAATTLLWNVLGHIPTQQRVAALKNAHFLLRENGLLILDVNNLFNKKTYGVDNVMRNKRAVQKSANDSTIGDFHITKKHNSQLLSTKTHIFHKSEVIQLVIAAGFKSPKIQYIDYETGALSNESNGQIVLTAKKRGTL